MKAAKTVPAIVAEPAVITACISDLVKCGSIGLIASGASACRATKRNYHVLPRYVKMINLRLLRHVSVQSVHGSKQCLRINVHKRTVRSPHTSVAGHLYNKFKEHRVCPMLSVTLFEILAYKYYVCVTISTFQGYTICSKLSLSVFVCESWVALHVTLAPSL